jgi:hypothetical protein
MILGIGRGKNNAPTQDIEQHPNPQQSYRIASPMADQMARHGADSKAMEAYYGDVVAPSEIVKGRGITSDASPLDGYVLLTHGGADCIQHMPYSEKSGEAGVIARIIYPEQGPDDIKAENRLMLAYLMGWAPGRIRRDFARVHSMEPSVMTLKVK